MSDIGPLSAEEMLQRAAQNVASGNNSKPKSAVEKLLAEREAPLEDKVDISPVQRLLQEREARTKDKVTPYTEQDWFLRLKINQLRAQIHTYSTVPGLDPSGEIMAGIEKEVMAILKKQNDRLQESLKKGDEAKARLEEQKRLEALKGPSPADLLAKVQGKLKKPALSKEVQALLDKLK